MKIKDIRTGDHYRATRGHLEARGRSELGPEFVHTIVEVETDEGIVGLGAVKEDEESAESTFSAVGGTTPKVSFLGKRL